MARQVWKWEPSPRWVRAVAGGETVADSRQTMLMIESPGELDYYFPLEDVRLDLLLPSDHTETSGYRGTRRFWHLETPAGRIENAAWTYDPHENRPDFAGYVALVWKKMDHWYEEEEEVFLHPRNPYHRVDYLPSSRHVEVFVDSVQVAETRRPLMVFETSLPTRIYIPEDDVDDAWLEPNESASHCPYKGNAAYYTVGANGSRIEKGAWYYPNPLPEAPRLAGKIAFWPEKDKRLRILVDGLPL